MPADATRRRQVRVLLREERPTRGVVPRGCSCALTGGRRLRSGAAEPVIAQLLGSRVLSGKLGRYRITPRARSWLQSHESRSPTMAVRVLPRRMLPIAFLMATVSWCGPSSGDEPAAGLPADLIVRVDGLFAKWNRPESPGCAVGIVHHGQLIYSKGFGSANLEYRVANTPQTVFEAASFSKSLTCACLAILM